MLELLVSTTFTLFWLIDLSATSDHCVCISSGFPCRCGGIFCSTHRYANEHSCTFDYREHGAEEIRKNNPQVIGEKIQKI